MAGVFISYRREDTPAHAGRLYERLAARYGKRRIFRDLDAVPIAKDFRQRINEAMSSCDVLIALIGKDWLTVTDASGRPRLHDPRDWLRVEIATALGMNKVVIPVLVEDAHMPSEDDLPAPLKPLAYLQALRTSEQDWNYHVGVLIRAIEENTDLGPGDYRPWAAYALMIAGIATRIIGGRKPISDEEAFVSGDFAVLSVLAVVLALLPRRPRLRLVACGMVVGSGIGTVLRYAQSLMGSELGFGEPFKGMNIDGTLALYYVGLGSGLLLTVGGVVLYLSTPREGVAPSSGQRASAVLVGFLGLAAMAVSIIAAGDGLFTMRNTAWPAVVPVGLAIVTLLTLMAMISSTGFWPMGSGLLSAFGLQAVFRFRNDLGKAEAGTELWIWIGIVGGVLILAAGLIGAVRSGRTNISASLLVPGS